MNDIKCQHLLRQIKTCFFFFYEILVWTGYTPRQMKLKYADAKNSMKQYKQLKRNKCHANSESKNHCLYNNDQEQK